MSRMIRKEIRLRQWQDDYLKRRARELGATQSEVIRRAIDSFIEAERPDVAAWHRIREFAETNRSFDTPQVKRTWTRDDLYDDDERFKRYGSLRDCSDHSG